MHFVGGDPPRLRDARNLQLSVAWAYVWVEATAGSSHGIGWNGIVRAQAIFRTVGGDPILHRVGEFLRRWTKIAATGGGRIVAIARGGRTGVKVFRIRKTLADQPGAADGAVASDDQTAIGFFVKESLTETVNDQRVEAAATTARTSVLTMAPRISEKKSFMVRQVRG